MRGNPHPKPIPAELRGKKPKLSEKEPSRPFPALFLQSQYDYIKSHGGAIFLRKLVREEMNKDSNL